MVSSASPILFHCLRCTAISRQPPHATRCEHPRCGGKVVPVGGTVDDGGMPQASSAAFCVANAMTHLIVKE